MAVLPLSVDDRSRGAIEGGWRGPVAFDAELVDFLEEVADLVGRTSERIRVGELEQALGEKLQNELLALSIRSHDAVISARYESSVALPGVGGDWYDAFELAPRRIGVVVGDVVGHGIESAAVMSQLRSALAAAALETHGAAATIDAVDRFAAHLPGARMATAAYAIIDTNTATIEYCCAGHPPPLMVSPHGTVEYLSGFRRPPLAVNDRPAFQDSGSHPFPPGSLLLLYTDGLIERRRESLDTGLDRLRDRVAGAFALPVKALTEGLLEQALHDGAPDDDMAVIAVRATGATRQVFAQVFPADPRQLALMRRRLREWLDARAADREQRDDIVLAVDEAMTNAIEHGSLNSPSNVITLEASNHEDKLVIAVSDSGSWRAKPLEGSQATRGRGHKLMEVLVDELEVATDRFGTTITLTSKDPRIATPA